MAIRVSQTIGTAIIQIRAGGLPIFVTHTSQHQSNVASAEEKERGNQREEYRITDPSQSSSAQPAQNEAEDSTAIGMRKGWRKIIQMASQNLTSRVLSGECSAEGV